MLIKNKIKDVKKIKIIIEHIVASSLLQRHFCSRNLWKGNIITLKIIANMIGTIKGFNINKIKTTKISANKFKAP